MPTSNGHGQTSSEYEPLLSGNVETGHHGQQHQSQSVGEILLRHQRPTVDAVKSAMNKLISIYTFLVFAPLGLVAGIFKWNPILVSLTNFLAIIPLSAAVSTASDKLADHLGFLIGTLINATVGNVVELSVGILAIIHKEIGMAQSTMLGSILSDILLVLGACLIAAAGRSRVLKFNSNVVTTLSSLMMIAAVALILPTALYSTFPDTSYIKANILSFSRATACVFLLIYTAYIYFQFWTHSDVFVKEADDVGEPEEAAQSRRQSIQETQGSIENSAISEQEADRPELGKALLATAVLIGSGATIVVCTHFFFDNLNETAQFFHVTKTFIALIVIPFASNAPEGSTVIAASRREQIDYAIGVIVGSILQIALFVLPVLIIVGWVVGRQMTLYFEVSQTCILFLSLLMVNHLLRDGKYTYLHGMMLLSMYAVITMAFLLQNEN